MFHIPHRLPPAACIFFTSCERDRAITRTTRTFIALALAHSLVDCYGGAWPIFKYRAGLDLELAGLLATVTLFIGAGLQPIIGLWADHGHERRFAILGAALSALGFAVGSLAMMLPRDNGSLMPSAYVAFGILLLVTRIGQALFHPPGASTAGSLVPLRRGTFVSAFIACGLFGFAFSHGLFSLAYDLFDGWTHWMLLPAALIVLIAIIWLKPDNATQRRPIAWRQVKAALHEVRGPLFTLFLIQSMLAALHLGVIFLIPEFIDAAGFPAWLSHGGGFMCFVLGSVAVMVPVGILADRKGARRMMLRLLGLSIMAFYLWIAFPKLAAPAGLAQVSGVTTALFCVMCAAAGASTNTTQAVGVTLGQHLSPKHANVISGVLMGLAWAVGSWGQWAAGALASRPSLGPAGALAILGAVLVPCLLLALTLPQDRRQAAMPAADAEAVATAA